MSNIDGNLTIGDKEYDASEVLRIGKSGPTIEINESEINFDQNTIKFEQIDLIEDINNESVILFKYEGKFIIIFGLNKINEQRENKKYRGKLIGKLISTPMIKKCRIDRYEFIDESVVAVSPSVIKKQLNNDSKNHQGKKHVR